MHAHAHIDTHAYFPLHLSGLPRAHRLSRLLIARTCSRSTNGDGKISVEEFEKNLKPRTRAKIEELLDAGWKFDEKLWLESQERHKDDPAFDAAKAY